MVSLVNLNCIFYIVCQSPPLRRNTLQQELCEYRHERKQVVAVVVVLPIDTTLGN